MKNNCNLPNALSVFRILLVPVFIVTYFLVDMTPNYVAFGIFIFASATDLIDGFIARRHSLVTNVGKVLDPLADKFLKISVFVCFAITNIVPIWVLGLILLLDLSLIIAASILFKREIVIASNNFGKAGTVIITIGVILSFFEKYLNNINLYIIYVGIFVVLLSVLSYLHIYLKIKKQNVLKTK